MSMEPDVPPEGGIGPGGDGGGGAAPPSPPSGGVRRATVKVPARLERALKRFANEAGNYLSTATRTEVPLEFAFAGLAGRAEILGVLSSGWCVCFEFQGEKRGIVAFDGAVALYLVESCFGGGTDDLRAEKNARPLTDLEDHVARELAYSVSALLIESLAAGVEANLRPPSILAGPADRAFAGLEDEGWLARFAVGEISQALTLILPKSPEVDAQGAGGVTGSGRQIMAAMLEMSVSVGEVHTTLSELSRLNAGDILPVTAYPGGRLQVQVEGIPKLQALPCVSRGLRSIQVLGEIRESGSSS